MMQFQLVQVHIRVGDNVRWLNTGRAAELTHSDGFRTKDESGSRFPARLAAPPSTRRAVTNTCVGRTWSTAWGW